MTKKYDLKNGIAIGVYTAYAERIEKVLPDHVQVVFFATYEDRDIVDVMVRKMKKRGLKGTALIAVSNAVFIGRGWNN